MTLHEMTADQVREAAIELCLLEGLDPHAHVFVDGDGHGSLCEQWENQAEMVRAWLNVMRAVNKVARRYN